MSFRFVVGGLISILFLPSCDIIEPKTEPRKVQLNLKSAEIIDAGQQFAFELFHSVCSRSHEENIMVSPLSVSYALGMTLNGAAGTTLDSFNSVLHFWELSNQEINESYKNLMDQLVHLDDKVEFSIANSIWYREGASVLEDFIFTNQTYFDAAVEELNFADPKAKDIINDWIEEKTNDKIQDMLDFIPPGVYMYLINAIYFNATWKYEFDVEDTYPGTFDPDSGGAVSVDYMTIEGDFYYTSCPDFTAVELPYGDSTFSMVAILPSGDMGIEKLIDSIDLEKWESRHAYSSPRNVHVEMPKFKYGFKKLLNNPLTDLGLGIAFGGGADFSRITAEADLYISRVIHQSFIDVQEKGTEAAAATIVELRESAGEGPERIIFNKPFLYIIKENSTGAILFMGKVGKPVYED